MDTSEKTGTSSPQKAMTDSKGQASGEQQTLILGERMRRVQATLHCSHRQTKIQTTSHSVPWPNVLPAPDKIIRVDGSMKATPTGDGERMCRASASGEGWKFALVQQLQKLKVLC